MKPSEIVFRRSYCSNVQACTKNDLKAAKDVKLFGLPYSTQDVALKLLINGSIDFKNALAGRNIAGVKFQMVSKDNLCLLIDVYFAEKQDPVAQIELRSDTDVAVKNQHCQGAITITLNCNNTAKDAQVIPTEQRKCIESFALNVGLYFLAVHDGQWYKPLFQCLEKKADIPVHAEELQIALNQCQEQLETNKMQLNQLVKEHNILCTRLQYQIKQNQKRITALKSNLNSYKIKEDTHTASETEEDFKEDFDYVALLKETIKGKRICLVGGKENWQTKVVEIYPDVVVLGAKNFDPNKMETSDILIINTNDVGHALTGKAQNIAGNKNIRIIFTSKYNMQRFAEEVIYNLT